MDILGRFYRSKVQLDFTFTTPKIMIGIQSGGDPMNVRLACFAAAMLTVTFSTVSFSQGTREQRRACKDDAFRLCRDTIPDVPRITECMHKNQKKLSPVCKAFFKPG